MWTIRLLTAVLAVAGVCSLARDDPDQGQGRDRGRGQGYDVRVSLSKVSTLYLPTVTPDGTPTFPFPSFTLEQLSFHPPTKIIYGVGNDHIHVIDASDVTKLTSLDTIVMPTLELSDVEVCEEGVVVVSYGNNSDLLQGGVLLFRLYDTAQRRLELIRNIPLGTLPDMLLPSADCGVVVVALENEMREEGGVITDPPGGVGIIRFTQGLLAPPTVKILDFTAFDDRFPELAAQGVRWVFRGNDVINVSFSDNIEPEFVALNHDYTKAYVTLQENNAIAVVDLETETITDVRGLGFKEWGDLDPSDRDGGILIRPWPILGMYQPDSVEFVRWAGTDYLITANEGDALDTPESVGFRETKRGHDLDNISPSVPQTLRDALKDDSRLGRHVFSDIDGRDSEGALHTLHTYGARSFSVWRADDGTRVFDSGSDIERRTAQLRPDIFNNNGVPSLPLAQTVDLRSDDKGPETESIETGVVGGHLLIFASSERGGSTIAVYSVAPGGMLPEFQTLYSGLPRDSGNSTWSELHAQRELSSTDPESMQFVPVSAGLADFPVLLVGGAFDGTVSVLRVDVTKDSRSSRRRDAFRVDVTRDRRSLRDAFRENVTKNRRFSRPRDVLKVNVTTERHSSRPRYALSVDVTNDRRSSRDALRDDVTKDRRSSRVLIRDDVTKDGRSSRAPLRDDVTKDRRFSRDLLKDDVTKDGRSSRDPIRDDLPKDGRSSRVPLRNDVTKDRRSSRDPIRDDVIKVGRSSRVPLRDNVAKDRRSSRDPIRDDVTQDGRSSRARDSLPSGPLPGDHDNGRGGRSRDDGRGARRGAARQRRGQRQ